MGARAHLGRRANPNRKLPTTALMSRPRCGSAPSTRLARGTAPARRLTPAVTDWWAQSFLRTYIVPPPLLQRESSGGAAAGGDDDQKPDKAEFQPGDLVKAGARPGALVMRGPDWMWDDQARCHHPRTTSTHPRTRLPVAHPTTHAPTSRPRTDGSDFASKRPADDNQSRFSLRGEPALFFW